MKRKLLYVLVAVLIGIQFVRPERTNPPVDPNRTVQAHLPVPEAVTNILKRSCYDCHSNETRWPWYSNIAPISWLIADDVDHGRSHVNFSEWPAEDPKKVRKILDEVCEVVEEGEMPLEAYVWLHPSAKLSEQDVATICEWTEQAIQQLGEPSPTTSEREGETEEEHGSNNH